MVSKPRRVDIVKKMETCLPGLHKIFKRGNPETIRPVCGFQEAREYDTGKSVVESR
jgi:hypothetical protein